MQIQYLERKECIYYTTRPQSSLRGLVWLGCIYIIHTILVYVTGELEPSGGSVSTGPNLTDEMEPGMNTNI